MSDPDLRNRNVFRRIRNGKTFHDASISVGTSGGGSVLGTADADLFENLAFTAG